MNRPTELLITHQGRPQVNNAVVVYQSETVALVLVDMKSKWCNVDSTANKATFWVRHTDNSTNLLDMGRERRDDLPHSTRVTLPEFSEWEFFGLPYCNRYTIYITLQKQTT